MLISENTESAFSSGEFPAHGELEGSTGPSPGENHTEKIWSTDYLMQVADVLFLEQIIKRQIWHTLTGCYDIWGLHIFPPAVERHKPEVQREASRAQRRDQREKNLPWKVPRCDPSFWNGAAKTRTWRPAKLQRRCPGKRHEQKPWDVWSCVQEEGPRRSGVTQYSLDLDFFLPNHSSIKDPWKFLLKVWRNQESLPSKRQGKHV